MLDRRDESPAVPTEVLDPSAAAPAKPVRDLASAAPGVARASLARWLSTRRTERNMTLDDVARITKIQPRILERLESGQLDGLPADVFVRGFVRSFAKSIGLDEDEALKRYAACGQHAPAPVAAAARAM